MGFGRWRAVSGHGRDIVDAVVASPDQVLMAFDFDGTLAEIRSDPEAVSMFEPAAQALAKIADRVGRIAVITGRQAETVVRLGRLAERPGFARSVVFGQYGAESWDAASGRYSVPPPPDGVVRARADLEALLASAEREGRSMEGVAIEDKRLSVAVHYRNASDAEAARWLAGPVARIAEANGLDLEPGRLVLELRFARTDKGAALARLIDQERPGCVLMFGDDLGDLPAFAVVREARESGLAGANVVSASDEAAALLDQADVLCDGPPGVAALLEDLADALAPCG